MTEATEQAPAPPARATRPPASAARAGRRWWMAVAAALLLVLALGLRLAYIHETPGYVLRHDATDYDIHAVSIANGQGFSKRLSRGRVTAFRPPGYPYLLGAVYRITGVQNAPAPRRIKVARAEQAVVGTVVVALVGLLALQLWGPTVALVALGLAAIYLPLILVGGAVMSEPLFDVFMLAALCAAVAHRHSPHRWRFALLCGVLAGLAILTRANALILLAPLAVAAWDGRPRWSRAALGPPLALIVVAALTVTPWTIRNARTLHHFVPVTTQLGSAMAGTYNAVSAHDPVNPAAWRPTFEVPEYRPLYRHVRRINEAVMERELRAGAERYIAHHPTYVATVAWWSTRRMLDLAGARRWRATAATIGIDRLWADRGVLCFWAFAILAVAGAFTRLARRAPAFVWAVPVLMYLSVVFLVFETPRYRTPIDPFIVLLAALALVAGAARLARARRASQRSSATLP
jgi:4-amino-4-deoxy-L-arabinose transferase-like glycosyltransferase